MNQLARVLTVFAHEGRVSREEALAALQPGGVDKLLRSPALTPFDQNILAECEKPTGRPRRVTVKRKP